MKTTTIAVLNYNGKNFLKDTFDSIYKIKDDTIEDICLIDNASIDGSVDFVRRHYPHINILELEQNYGACKARNMAISKARSDCILLVDNDVVLKPDVLFHLKKAFQTDPNAGIASAQIRYFDDPETIQYNGVYIHFAGGAIRNKSLSGEPIKVHAVPATTILVDVNKARYIGLFDEDFFYGWEDGDFSFRMTLAGHSVLVVPEAIVLHKKRKRGLKWIEYQIRNRWWFIIKTYNTRTLLLAFPAILLYQSVIFFFLLLKGECRGYIQGIRKVIESFPMVLLKRKEVMKYKIEKDKNVLKGNRIDIHGDEDRGFFVAVSHDCVNLLLSIYWLLIRKFID